MGFSSDRGSSSLPSRTVYLDWKTNNWYEKYVNCITVESNIRYGAKEEERWLQMHVCIYVCIYTGMY